MIVKAERNVFEGQKNEIRKKINKMIERDDKLWHRKKLPSCNDGENILERSGATKCSVRSRSNMHESRRNRQITKNREHCNEKNLETPKWAAHKQHEGENSKEQSSLPRTRRIVTGNNEVLKRILEDSKKHKKSKWWETTRKYMNWAQIEEREIKERTAKEIRGNIAKVVEEECREELKKKNSLVIYRRLKKEMK